MYQLSGLVTLFYSANPWILGAASIVVLSFFVLVICISIHWLNRRPTLVNLPSLPKRDFTLQELSQFDGTASDGRILIGVNGNVFDVTHDGKGFYGKDGPYAIFAGRDASRALTMFTTDIPVVPEEYDDLSDLSSDEMNRLLEWELQFRGMFYSISDFWHFEYC